MAGLILAFFFYYNGYLFPAPFSEDKSAKILGLTKKKGFQREIFPLIPRKSTQRPLEFLPFQISINVLYAVPLRQKKPPLKNHHACVIPI